MDKVYVYAGDGAGIPGLPHRVTEAEAQELGLSDVLEAAIANGSYRIVTEDRGPATDPVPTEKGKGRKAKE